MMHTLQRRSWFSQEGVVDSDPDAIGAFVRSNAPGVIRVRLETGPTATWLWTELKRLGLPVICIDARHAKAVHAAGIARIMQTSWLKEVRVKDIDSHSVPRQRPSSARSGMFLIGAP